MEESESDSGSESFRDLADLEYYYDDFLIYYWRKCILKYI